MANGKFPTNESENPEPLTPNVEYSGYKSKTKNDNNIWRQREENVLQRQLRAKVWGMQGTDQKQNGYKSSKTE